MADIFVSYARADKARVGPLVAALEAEGWSVWWDPEITGGQEFDDLIAKELENARAAIVVWTPASVSSRWVRGEARIAADRGILVPVQIGAPNLPIDARALHTIDLSDWKENASGTPFQELVRALLAHAAPAEPRSAQAKGKGAKAAAICVLPFVNMSGDPEQEYFSDGISEDIITDLSKVSSLWVAARNTAFAHKGKTVDLAGLAQQLKVTHVLEGSVRKSGNRVRITAQLIDASNGGHVWAERFDRDLSDIFAVQDEISKAIVSALRVSLLPEERRAIQERGTNNPEAYKYVLMARGYANQANASNKPITKRLYQRAVEVDPNYADAWAKLARMEMNEPSGMEPGKAMAERALALDPNSAAAHAAMSKYLAHKGDNSGAMSEIEIALRLDPDAYEVNGDVAQFFLNSGRYQDALKHFVRASEILEGDWENLAMAVQCYQGMGDLDGAKAMARRAIKRIEAHIATNPQNAAALAFGAATLAMLGEGESAKDWAERAIIIAPDDAGMKYNLGCAMALLGEIETAIDYVAGNFKVCTPVTLAWFKIDSDLDPLRDHPRFKAIVAEAEERIAREYGPQPDSANGAKNG